MLVLIFFSFSDSQNNWVPRRGDQGPKTIDQIHKEAEMEEHREQIKVQQQLLSRKESRGPHTPARGRVNQPQDEGWNTVPISKNRPIDITRLSKITKVKSKSVHLTLIFHSWNFSYFHNLSFKKLLFLNVTCLFSYSPGPWTSTISDLLRMGKGCGAAGERAAVEEVGLNQLVEIRVNHLSL